jgi:hypothetical protein
MSFNPHNPVVRMFPWKFTGRIVRVPRRIITGAQVVENNRRYGLGDRMPNRDPRPYISFSHWIECNSMGGVQDESSW